VTATDPATYVVGAVVLFAIGLLVCAVPALRAVRISPMRSLAEP
jgi:ABC-type antimicrobial peptide transport system permease subunit